MEKALDSISSSVVGHSDIRLLELDSSAGQWFAESSCESKSADHPKSACIDISQMTEQYTLKIQSLLQDILEFVC